MQKTTKQRLDAVLSDIRKDPTGVTAEQLAGLWTPARETLNAYVAALDAHDADLAARKYVLEQQAEALDAKLAGLERQITQLEAESRQAASRGDLNAAAASDEQADALRKQAATAQRKRRIASSAELRGDSGLYSRILDAKRAYNETYAECQAAAYEAASLISGWSKLAAELERAAKRSAMCGPVQCAADVKRFAAIESSLDPAAGPSGEK